MILVTIYFAKKKEKAKDVKEIKRALDERCHDLLKSLRVCIFDRFRKQCFPLLFLRVGDAKRNSQE